MPRLSKTQYALSDTALLSFMSDHSIDISPSDNLWWASTPDMSTRVSGHDLRTALILAYQAVLGSLEALKYTNPLDVGLINFVQSQRLDISPAAGDRWLACSPNLEVCVNTRNLRSAIVEAQNEIFERTMKYVARQMGEPGPLYPPRVIETAAVLAGM